MPKATCASASGKNAPSGVTDTSFAQSETQTPLPSRITSETKAKNRYALDRSPEGNRFAAYLNQIIFNPITTKRCAKCGIEKHVEEFSKNSTGRNGLHSYCKECKLSDDRAYALKRLDKVKEKQRTEYAQMMPEYRPKPKLCSNPNCPEAGFLQPPENFHKSKIHKTGLLPDCMMCERERKLKSAANHRDSTNERARQKYSNDPEIKAYRKRWHNENRDYLNKKMKDWREENPEQVKEMSIKRRFSQYGVTPEWYEKQLQIQGGMCAICGSTNPKSNGDTFHVDHNHSCCSKGCHACDNCRRGLLCGPCNTRLGVLEITDWVKQAKAYLRKYPLKDSSGNDQPSLFDNP